MREKWTHRAEGVYDPPGATEFETEGEGPLATRARINLRVHLAVSVERAPDIAETYGKSSASKEWKEFQL